MPANPAIIGSYKCGPGQPLLLIAGPCVIESKELTLSIAVRLKKITDRLPVQLIFKASFDKANRTSAVIFVAKASSQGSKSWLRLKPKPHCL